MITFQGKRYEPVEQARLRETCPRCALFNRQLLECKCHFLCTDFGSAYNFKLIEEVKL